VTYSLDEMTGIQALERVMPEIDMKPGRCVRVEFEYQRHGTQSLIATFNVATGGIDHASVGDTRTEQDLDAHLKALLAQVANAPRFIWSWTASIPTNQKLWCDWLPLWNLTHLR
jgi:hypothetical protein